MRLRHPRGGGRGQPLGARAYTPLGRARPPKSGPTLLRVPLGRARPLLRAHAPRAVHPPCRTRPVAVHAPIAVRPSLPCAPHVRAFLTRPCPYRVRLPSISPTNLLFIPPLGHPGL
jgi:hypothetical protein